MDFDGPITPEYLLAVMAANAYDEWCRQMQLARQKEERKAWRKEHGFLANLRRMLRFK